MEKKIYVNSTLVRARQTIVELGFGLAARDVKLDKDFP